MHDLGVGIASDVLAVDGPADCTGALVVGKLRDEWATQLLIHDLRRDLQGAAGDVGYPILFVGDARMWACPGTQWCLAYRVRVDVRRLAISIDKRADFLHDMAAGVFDEVEHVLRIVGELDGEPIPAARSIEGFQQEVAPLTVVPSNTRDEH